MVRAGDQIENPVTGQRIVFRRTSEETGGVVSEFDGIFRKGGFAGPEHVHPIQDERFEVIAGQAGFMVGGEQKTLGPKGIIDVPRGVRHTVWNQGNDDLHIRNYFHPGTPSTERFYETFFRLGREGKVNRSGMPNLLLVAMLAPQFADHVRLASPPWWLQRATFATLRPIALLLGYRRRAEQLAATPQATRTSL
jgi:mannose-6-phosphate isomerase-like protein (cupin superfamily)